MEFFGLSLQICLNLRTRPASEYTCFARWWSLKVLTAAVDGLKHSSMSCFSYENKKDQFTDKSLWLLNLWWGGKCNELFSHTYCQIKELAEFFFGIRVFLENCVDQLNPGNAKNVITALMHSRMLNHWCMLFRMFGHWCMHIEQ